MHSTTTYTKLLRLEETENKDSQAQLVLQSPPSNGSWSICAYKEDGWKRTGTTIQEAETTITIHGGRATCPEK